mmetsp:Transcript_12058/g.25459  ORF Transcript_12058/g.25459 Transcript_12058/m.25459 type:complete len:273 (+) Transcript_12058:516-1334(+)
MQARLAKGSAATRWGIATTTRAMVHPLLPPKKKKKRSTEGRTGATSFRDPPSKRSASTIPQTTATTAPLPPANPAASSPTSPAPPPPSTTSPKNSACPPPPSTDPSSTLSRTNRPNRGNPPPTPPILQIAVSNWNCPISTTPSSAVPTPTTFATPPLPPSPETTPSPSNSTLPPPPPASPSISPSPTPSIDPTTASSSISTPANSKRGDNWSSTTNRTPCGGMPSTSPFRRCLSCSGRWRARWSCRSGRRDSTCSWKGCIARGWSIGGIGGC